MFKNSKIKLENLTLAKGRVLIEKTKNPRIYKVLKIAQNVNYDSLGKIIEIGDLIVSDEYLFNQMFKIGNDEYYIIKPSSIVGFF